MSTFPYMRFYFGDYLSKTHGLTTTQHGAYFLLLAAMWGNHGFIEDDDETLAQVTRLPVKKWKTMRPKLERFFIRRDGKLTQSRLIDEWNRTAAKSASAVVSGKLGGLRKSMKYNTMPLANAKQSLSERVAIPDKNIIEEKPSPTETTTELTQRLLGTGLMNGRTPFKPVKYRRRQYQ
jgi:uncharacterized protein YdaU (DUF1376 family)